MTELGPFDFSHFERFDQTVELQTPNILESVTVLGEKCRLVLLRCKGTPPCFPAILAQRDNFYDFLFASLDKVALQNRDLLLQNRGSFDKFNFDRMRAI